MLKFDTGIFDPATREASLAAAVDALGLTLPEGAVETYAGQIGDVLGDPPAPEEWADYAARLSEYLSVLVMTVAYMQQIQIAGILGQTDVPNIATADATDLASAVALANATKTTLNTLLARLRTAGILTT